MADPTTPQVSPASIPKPRTSAPPSAIKTAYLIAYNSVSALLWTVVLGRVLLVGGLHGFGSVFLGTGEFVKWTQSLAVLEVVHAAFGIVRADMMTTAMQVASRLVLVWGIVDKFPNTTAFTPFYSSMLLAWSVTEVIRYTFFATSLSFGSVPGFLLWLRYNTFWVLYPIGISSECILMWLARAPAESWNLAYKYLINAILFIYCFGAPFLYSHLMAQRRKVMRGKKAPAAKSE